jgi:ABC-type transport system involved in multi-copper enzyme maturation permease subunit
MIAMLRADLLRLRTLRSSYAVPLTMFALVAAITGGTLSDTDSGGRSTATQLREPLTASAGIMVAVAMALFAAMRVAGEYRYDTMGQRLLTSPRRNRLLAASLSFHGLLGLILGAAALGVGLVIAAPMLEADETMALTPQIIAAVLLAVSSFSLIGVCCGVIFRSQAAAVLVIIGCLVGEKLLGMFIGDAAAYLPYGLLTPLLQLQGATISAASAAAALVATTVALVAMTVVVFSRRDITA